MNAVTTTRKLVSASAIMAAGTLISRILGVTRVVLLGFILGYGTRQADMFTIADTVPNSIYILFSGGALNSVLVPQIVRAIKYDKDGGEAYTNRIMTAFMIIVSAVTLLALAATPLITGLYTSSEWRAEELAGQYQSIIALTYLTLPQIFFYGIFFLLGQVLNARDQFGPMMWAPIANNIVSISVLSLYLFVWGNQQDHSQAFTSQQILLLGIGSTAGIAVQTLVLMPFLKKVGFKLRPRFDLRGVGLSKTFSLAKWTIGFVAVNQIAYVVVNRLATTATATGHGAGVNVYSNAHLLWILPHSLITVSLATAMLPHVSRLAASNDLQAVGDEFIKTSRLTLVAIVPATVAFFALSGPMVALLFSHGTGSQDALWIGWALLGFTVGLVPFTIQFMGRRTFYALEDTRTPFLLQSIIAGVNMGSGLLLIWLLYTVWQSQAPAWVAAALALSNSVAYFIGLLVTWRSLTKRVPLKSDMFAMHLVRLFLSAAPGGVAAYFAGTWILDTLGEGKPSALLACAAGGVLVLGSFVGLGKALKVRELTSLTNLIARRFGRGIPSAPTSPEGLPEDETPTTINHIVIIDDDGGPATVVRNRPPRVEHSFVHRASLKESIEEKPDMAFGELEDTGPLDTAALFAQEANHSIALVGTLINARYELIEPLASRHGTETWRAHDQVLSRDVVVHVIAPGDSRTTQLMQAARKGAAATDSRFLRVLDADEFASPVDGVGAYVVAEYAAGRSLERLLAKGALSSIEAAHITRELADALSGVHSQGLFHEQINPDNIIITNAGAVRIVGFGIETALVGSEEYSSWATREEADVDGMGKVLYAALVRHWPGGPAWGLPAAPVARGATVPARHLGASISPALDRIAAACLREPGGIGERRITTASQLVNELTSVLGTADASADLEQRVRAWTTSHDAPVEPIGIDDEFTAAQTVTTALPRRSGDDFGQYQRERKPRRALWIIVSLAAATLVISLILVAVGSLTQRRPAQNTPQPTVASTSAVPPQALQVASITGFDPESDGGNGDEHNDTADRVLDGDPATTWETMEYHNRSDLGGLKPGVGLVLDLGEARSVSSVDVTLTGPTAVELRVPSGDEASMQTQADWRIVASNAAAEGTVTLTAEQPVTTRWVLIYLTDLPQVSTARYRTAISEIRLSG